MDNESNMNASGKPKLFLLSLMLPFVWLTIGMALDAIAPGTHLGIVGTALLYVLVATAICWLIIRRHNRMPTNSESWRLVAYCSVLAVLTETWGILAAITWPEEFPDLQIEAELLPILLGASVVLNPLLLTLAFRVAAPRNLKSLVAKLEER